MNVNVCATFPREKRIYISIVGMGKKMEIKKKETTETKVWKIMTDENKSTLSVPSGITQQHHLYFAQHQLNLVGSILFVFLLLKTCSTLQFYNKLCCANTFMLCSVNGFFIDLNNSRIFLEGRLES